MREQELGLVVWRFARGVGVIVVGIFGAAGLFCLPAAWRTLHHFGNMTMLFGGLVMLVGALARAGHLVISWRFTYRLGKLYTGQTARQHVGWQSGNWTDGYRVMAMMGIAGGVAALLGELIR